MRPLRSYHHPIPSSELLRFSGHPKPAAYAAVLRSTQALLALSPRPTIAQLSIQHAASPAHTTLATSLLASYSSRLLASLPAAQRSQHDPDRPAPVLVAFYLAGKKSRDTPDREVLKRDGGISAKEWQAVEASMRQLCADVLGVKKRKRKTGDEDDEADEDKLEGGGAGRRARGRGGGAGGYADRSLQRVEAECRDGRGPRAAAHRSV